MKKIMFLSGLPRSGSTVLSNIMGMHPEINATPSSPLCNIVQSMRKTWSEDPFLKSQLDNNYQTVTERLKRTTLATMLSWSNEGKGSITLDKNRGWLFSIEWLREIFPDFKMIVTIRDIRDVYASIEKQHRKTLMLNFPDNMEHNIVDTRASTIFSNGGVVGSCLRAINNIGDVPDIVNNLMIWRYEDFIANPQETINKTFNFLNVNPIEIDFDNLIQNTHEADSYYNMKYLHSIHSKFEKPLDFNTAKMSPRIIQEITNKFKWYYDAYYPGLITDKPIVKSKNIMEDITSNEFDPFVRNLEVAIQEEIS